MADGGYIREYLVGLGFEVDERGLDAFRAALDIVEASASETDFQAQMKKQLFPDGCSGACYYPVNRVQ